VNKKVNGNSAPFFWSKRTMACRCRALTEFMDSGPGFGTDVGFGRTRTGAPYRRILKGPR
jgi:hypothetical protein